MGLTPGAPIPLFSVGISIGLAKCMASLSILWAACYGGSGSGLSDMTDEMWIAIGDHLMALMNVKATYVPESTVEGQVNKSLSKKLRFVDRPRPSAVQLHTAFMRIVTHKQGNGDKKPTSTLLAQAMADYNKKQTSKGKISVDERDAVLMLCEQLPAFLEALEAHWLNFPSKCSGVPTSFLSHQCLTSTYEPPIKKKENPKHYEMARNTPEKNLEWLRRCIGKYMKDYKDAKEKGSVSIESMGPLFRQGNSDEVLYHAVGIFCTYKDEYKKNVTVVAWNEIQGKFYRGGLDRELIEKAKSKDESLEVMDFRFIQGAQGYDPTASNTTQEVVASDARDKKFESDLKLDEITLQTEVSTWEEHMRKLKAFHANDQNSKTEHDEVLDEAWKDRAKEFIDAMFPTIQLRSWNDLNPSMNSAVNTFADYVEVLQGDVFRVLVFNLSFLSCEHTKMTADLKALIEGCLALDDARTCALVIGPVVAGYKQTLDEEALDKCTQALFDALRDGTMKVREITFMFDPATQWKRERRHWHKAFMCISKKVGIDKQLVSKFAMSMLWIRAGCGRLIVVMQRHECVDPTWVMAMAERGNLGDAQERKQWISGVSLYAELGEALWSGMNLTPKNKAAWLDAIPYDAMLPLAVLSRSGVPSIEQPREMVASFLWHGNTADKKAMENYITKTIRNKLKAKCKGKEFTIQGAPDISEPSSGVQVRVPPTYDEKHFTLTKPMADKSLPCRKTFVDKWAGNDVPQKFKDLFKAMLIKHDSKHNKSSIPYAGEVSKRKAEGSDGGEGAKTLTPEADAPKTQADVEKLHGAVKTKFLQQNPKTQLLVADDGAIFVQTGDELELLLAENPLHTYAGEYFIGKDFEKKAKDGVQMFRWSMENDEFVASFRCEPEMKKEFDMKDDRATLREFLQYLAQNGKVNVDIECHTNKRVKPKSNDELSTYEISNTEVCGYQPRAGTGPKALLGATTPTTMETCKHVGLVMRLKFLGEDALIAPGRPLLMLKKSIRIPANTLLKL